MAYALGPTRSDESHHRIFGRRHPRRVVLIALAALAVIGAAGAIVAVHRAVTRVAAPGEVPVIHADAEPTRKRPDNPGGMQIPGQGTLVLDGGHDDSKVEQLLPLPEAPLPRPTPVEPMVATPPPPPPAVTVPTAAAPPAAPAIPPPTVKAAPAAVSAAPAAAAGKAYRLQLGAVRTPAAAKDEFERLKRLNSDVLGKLGYTAERVDLGERGIFYRIQAGPLADAALAERDCSALNRRGVRCLLVKP
jgi:cell division septation protein DedD